MIFIMIKRMLLVFCCCYSFQLLCMGPIQDSGELKEAKSEQNTSCDSERQVSPLSSVQNSPNSSQMMPFFRLLCMFKKFQTQAVGVKDLKKFLETFLQGNVNVNEQITFQTTLLHCLVEMGDVYLPLIKMLVEKGARFNIPNGVGETAIDVAQRIKNGREILVYFTRCILQHQEHKVMPAVIQTAHVPTYSSSSSSQSSSSATTECSTKPVLMVPASIAAEIDASKQVSDGEPDKKTTHHQRNVSTSLSIAVPSVELNQLSVVSMDETIDEEKELEKEPEDDMAIYDIGEHDVLSPAAQRMVALSTNSDHGFVPARVSADEAKTPNNSAPGSVKSTLSSPLPVHNNVDEQFPSVSSDRSEKSDHSMDPRMPMIPNVPQNSAASTYRISSRNKQNESHSSDRSQSYSYNNTPEGVVMFTAHPPSMLVQQTVLAVSPTQQSSPVRRHAHSADSALSSKTQGKVDLLMFAAERSPLQSPVTPRLELERAQAQKNAADHQKTYDEKRDVVPSQLVTVTGMTEAISSSSVTSPRDVGEYKNTSPTVHSSLEQEGRYTPSRAVMEDSVLHNNQTHAASVGQWTHPIIVLPSRPWYERLFGNCCGHSS